MKSLRTALAVLALVVASSSLVFAHGDKDCCKTASAKGSKQCCSTKSMTKGAKKVDNKEQAKK
jgi:hypothetical protein